MGEWDREIQRLGGRGQKTEQRLWEGRADTVGSQSAIHRPLHPGHGKGLGLGLGV